MDTNEFSIQFYIFYLNIILFFYDDDDDIFWEIVGSRSIHSFIHTNKTNINNQYISFHIYKFSFFVLKKKIEISLYILSFSFVENIKFIDSTNLKANIYNCNKYI